jgi:thymidylate kinase
MNLDEVRGDTLFASHREAGRLVVVEGDPGAGKTSAIAAAACDTNAYIVPQLDHATDDADSRDGGPGYPEDWYLDMERARQSGIRDLLRSGRLILQDRNVLSTLAFAFASTGPRGDRSRLCHLLGRLAEGQRCVRPDVVVIMHVDVEVGLARRRSVLCNEKYRAWFNRDFLTRFQEFYRVVTPRIVTSPTKVIDTSSLSREATCNVLAASCVGLLASGAYGSPT